MDFVNDVIGGGEMDTSQNGEVALAPQPEAACLGIQDTEMEEDEARSEATFRFTVNQFSKLKVIFLMAFLYPVSYCDVNYFQSSVFHILVNMML